MEYSEFLKTKQRKHIESGFEILETDLNPMLFDFQKMIVQKALKVGKYAIFADCGLGKTPMQLEWAHQVTMKTNKPVLILAPLAVSGQTISEGKKFNIPIEKLKGEVFGQGVYITNYEQLNNINCSVFSGIVLDESSILKNYSGAYRNLIIELFNNTPYKLACTASPSPNDELELGNHSEFLNVMTSQDMRALYFTTEKERIKGDKYRIKKHAIKEFYGWVSSWAIMISKPSDIGFSDNGFILPKLNHIEYEIKTDFTPSNGLLFASNIVSAMTFNSELRASQDARLNKVIDICNTCDGQIIIWVKQNVEGDYLKKYLTDCKEVKGSDTIEYKETTLLQFANNEFRILITKAKIAQFGMNFQNCANQIFPSLDFSFESFYQQVRRSYRFGQKREVNIHLIKTDTMGNVTKAIEEKEEKFILMQDEMRLAITNNIIHKSIDKVESYHKSEFDLYNGDCVEVMSKMESDSIDYSFFSPPFGALYVFSDNPKDMSNVKNNDEFLEHFKFAIIELFRLIKPGRLCSIHMMQSTTLLGRDGFYSIIDFRGDLIRLFQSCGFQFHAENMIRKDPKTAAIRTKNRQLMWGTTKKDSSIVRPGLADYILTFKKPGENVTPIKNNIPFDLWCKIAEPVWIDIEEGNTIEYRSGRDEKDERHITATQLKPIEWCYLMWVNKGETVLSPFNGVGSEGYQALKMGIKYKGIELKKSYYEQSIYNCNSAVEQNKQLLIFEL